MFLEQIPILGGLNHHFAWVKSSSKSPFWMAKNHPFSWPFKPCSSVWSGSRGGLRGDSASSTGDDAGDAHVVLGEVVGEPELLVMAMPGDQQVQAHVGQALVETFRSTRLDTTRDDGFLLG